MFPRSRAIRASWLAITLALAWFPSSATLADADAREVSAYRLTDAGLQKYRQAVRNVAEIQGQAPGACGDEDDDEGENVTSIDAAVAKLVSTPGVIEALRSAGMPPREFVVFSMSVLQAGLAAWALEQPGGKLPPEVNMANVNFYRKNQAAMQQLGDATKSGACGDGGDEGDDDNMETGE